MSNILRFPQRALAKFGLRRARRRQTPENPDQLDLFSRSGIALKLPTGLSPFEEALVIDEAGDLGEAKGMYGRAIEEGDCVADAYCNLGVLQSQTGERDDAFDSFRSALIHDQRHWESHYNLGNLYFDGEEYRPARLHYELAAGLEPSFRNTFFNLGLLFAIDAEYPAAIDMLNRYRELTPGEEGVAADDLLERLRRSAAAQD